VAPVVVASDGSAQGPLLDRENELAVLRELVVRVARGAGGTLLVEGAGGLGKSRLLSTALDLASAVGVRARSVRCAELEQQIPWGAARVLLGPSPSGGGPGSEDPRGFAAQHAHLERVRRMAATAPTLLLIDDLQWCDALTMRLLVYLQQRVARLPVGIVAAARPEEAAHPMLYRSLTVGPATEVLRLRPLSEPSVASLVRALGRRDVDDAVCAACARVTGGNPFFLHALVAGLAETTDGTPLDAATVEHFTPPSVLRVIEQRLDRRGDACLRLARAMAIFGDGVPLPRAARLAGLELNAAIDAADALAAADLLTGGQPPAFVHPLVRHAVLENIPPARRAAEHRRAAELLVEESAPSDAVALQLVHALPVGARWAADVLLAAGRRAFEEGAPRTAVDQLRRALDEPPPTDGRIEVLVALGRAEAAAGLPDAVARFQDALALVDKPRSRAELLLRLGWTEHHLGRFGDAARTFDRGLAALAGTDPELAIQLELGYVTAGVLDADIAADAHARAAHAEQRLTGDVGPAGRALLAQALTTRAFAGDPCEALDELATRVWDDGRALREDGPHAETVWAPIGFWTWSDHYERALEGIESALVEARRRGSALAAARGRYARAWTRYWIGEFEGAIADARAAIDVWRGGLETYLPAAVYWLVLTLLEVGDVGAAEEALSLGGPAERWTGTALGVYLVAAEARLAFARGDPATALMRHLRCGELMARRLNVRNPALMPWRSQAALAALECDERERARTLAADAVILTERFGAPRAMGEARRVAALAAGGPLIEAELAGAVVELEAAGAPVELARALIDLGAAIRRGGRRAEARGPLRRGLDLARRYGAEPLAAQAAAELAASGARGAQNATGPLTPSEARVARMAAAGRTNREIGAALRVSVKAVEWHLHQTYRKLRIAGRRELSDALDALGDPG